MENCKQTSVEFTNWVIKNYWIYFQGLEKWGHWTCDEERTKFAYEYKTTDELYDMFTNAEIYQHYINLTKNKQYDRPTD